MPNLHDFLKQPLILKSVCVLKQDNLVSFELFKKWKEIWLSLHHFVRPSEESPVSTPVPWGVGWREGRLEMRDFPISFPFLLV